MSEVPKFIKEFSKSNAPEERAEVGREIWAKRSEHFKEKEVNIQRAQEAGAEKSELERSLSESEEIFDDLNEQLEEYNSSFVKKITKVLKIRKLKEEIKKISEHTASLQETVRILQSEIESLEKNESDKLVEAEGILDAFYARQMEQWQNIPYSREDVEKYFSEDYLRKLSLSDYIILLQRFPAAMVTHVTRQGVRDHSSQLEASSGFGKRHNGFKDILSDGRLRSFLATQVTDEQKRETILKFLSLDYTLGEKEALRQFFERYQFDKYHIVGEHTSQSMAASHVSGYYPDKSAVHFAVEEVADRYYGAERGNEIFFVFPSLHIASQYYFRQTFSLTEASGGFHNDLWTWQAENNGFDINAGIVFIPADVQVDRVTGSKYKIDDNQQAVVAEDGSLQGSDDLVSSQEYWENYFQQHPDQKPNKIFFYRGGDPSKALREFKVQNGLNTKTLDYDYARNLGFADRQISTDNPNANIGLERYLHLVMEMIDQYYAQQAA